LTDVYGDDRLAAGKHRYSSMFGGSRGAHPARAQRRRHRAVRGLLRKLFGTEPAKRRPGYANFAIAEPPLKLVLLEDRGQGGSLNHLGIEVADTDMIDAEQTRLAAAGLASVDERDTTCCYSGRTSSGSRAARTVSAGRSIRSRRTARPSGGRATRSGGRQSRRRSTPGSRDALAPTPRPPANQPRRPPSAARSCLSAGGSRQMSGLDASPAWVQATAASRFYEVVKSEGRPAMRAISDKGHTEMNSVRTRRQDAGPVVVIGAGQSGLAAARALLDHDLEPLVLEAGNRAAGSWPCYYDSLMAFSPAGFSSLRGMPFPGHPDHYPTRDEVASYLERYAARLGIDIITGSRVVTVRQHRRGFVSSRLTGASSWPPRWWRQAAPFPARIAPPSPDRKPSPARRCMWPITATPRPTPGSA